MGRCTGSYLPRSWAGMQRQILQGMAVHGLRACNAAYIQVMAVHGLGACVQRTATPSTRALNT
jgi:hypothetical protein